MMKNVPLNDYLTAYQTHWNDMFTEETPEQFAHYIMRYCQAMSTTNPDKKELVTELSKIDPDLLRLIATAFHYWGYDSF